MQARIALLGLLDVIPAGCSVGEFNMLRDDDMLAIASSTVIREEQEANRILLFNSLSDEMYVIPRQAVQVLKLCRGALTVSQIELALTFES